MDYGSSYTDRRQKMLSLRLQKVYREAQKDIEKDIADFTKRHKAKGEIMWQRLQNGEISQEKYHEWMRRQVFMGERWQSKLEYITESMKNTNEMALTLIRNEQFNVFAENANYMAFQIERDFKGAISFDIYDKSAVDRLVREKPELMPRSTLKSRKDKAWNQGIISNSLTQAIIQGDSIPDLAKRLARDTAHANDNSMMRYARTAMTCAQNAGRIDTMHRAQDMGISVQKQWLATLDNRTRHSHVHLDGQIRDVDEPFNSELGEIDYPGDPEADDQADVWNCRCTLTYHYPEYPAEQAERIAYDEWTDEDGEHRESFLLEPGATYGDWLQAKRERQTQRNTERAFWEEIERQEREIEELREKRAALFAQDTYDKNETDALLKEIAHRVDFVSAFRLAEGDYEITSELMSENVQDVANGVNKILSKEKYDLPSSVWNGRVIIDKGADYSGMADWDGTMRINEDATRDLKTYVHEHLHFRSVTKLVDPNVYTYYIAKNCEEGSVELLSQSIMDKAGSMYIGTYKELVGPLKDIGGTIYGDKNMYDFAMDLYKTPYFDRIGWLDKKVKAYKAENPNNTEEIAKIENAIAEMKKRKLN